MEYIFIISIIVNLVLSFFIVHKHKKEDDCLGTIIMFDKKNFYLELANPETMEKIYSKDFVTFAVKRQRPQK